MESDNWSVSGDIHDEDKTVDIPRQLTVTIFFTIVLQLIELQIPVSLVRIVLEFENETNFVQHPFSFRIHFAFSEGFTLRADPLAQCSLVVLCHIAYNTRRETVGVSGVFKRKIRWLTAPNNSQ
jgi:hypothetical protein